MPLTPSGVQQLVRNAAQEAGVQREDRPIYPHLLRHSFITEQLRRGMNPVLCPDRRPLGHDDDHARVCSHLVQSDAYNAMVRALALDDE